MAEPRQRPAPDAEALAAARNESQKLARGELAVDIAEHSFPYLLHRITQLEERIAALEGR